MNISASACYEDRQYTVEAPSNLVPDLPITFANADQ